MERETCKDCEQIFLELIATECGVENALECYTNDLPIKMCLKCVARIVNRLDKVNQ